MTFVDADGTVELNGRRWHVQALRDVNAATAAALVGVSVEALFVWAHGPGLPLGLWLDESSIATRPRPKSMLLAKIRDLADLLEGERERQGFVWIGTCPCVADEPAGEHLAYGFASDGTLYIATDQQPWAAIEPDTARARWPTANLPTWSPSWVS